MFPCFIRGASQKQQPCVTCDAWSALRGVTRDPDQLDQVLHVTPCHLHEASRVTPGEAHEASHVTPGYLRQASH